MKNFRRIQSWSTWHESKLAVHRTTIKLIKLRTSPYCPINGLRGKFGQANYTASKGGIIAFTKTMARELGNKNINVNAIAPGLIETDMVASMDEEAKDKSRKEIIMGRLGQPGEIADVVSFFCSDLSRHITGQVLNVDGGQLIA